VVMPQLRGGLTSRTRCGGLLTGRCNPKRSWRAPGALPARRDTPKGKPLPRRSPVWRDAAKRDSLWSAATSPAGPNGAGTPSPLWLVPVHPLLYTCKRKRRGRPDFIGTRRRTPKGKPLPRHSPVWRGAAKREAFGVRRQTRRSRGHAALDWSQQNQAGRYLPVTRHYGVR